MSEQVKPQTRRPCIVKNVYYGPESHGIQTCHITLDFEGGTSQSFGGLNLTQNGIGNDFVRQVSQIFNQTYINDIIGKKCYALTNFGNYSEQIEGIETDFGRVTLTSFLRKYNPKVLSPLERVKASHYEAIEEALQKVVKLVTQLEGIDKAYKDWG